MGILLTLQPIRLVMVKGDGTSVFLALGETLPAAV